jgi:hypothetical protein
MSLESIEEIKQSHKPPYVDVPDSVTTISLSAPCSVVLPASTPYRPDRMMIFVLTNQAFAGPAAAYPHVADVDIKHTFPANKYEGLKVGDKVRIVAQIPYQDSFIVELVGEKLYTAVA